MRIKNQGVRVNKFKGLLHESMMDYGDHYGMHCIEQTVQKEILGETLKPQHYNPVMLQFMEDRSSRHL